jgi:hypothetical protein
VLDAKSYRRFGRRRIAFGRMTEPR